MADDSFSVTYSRNIKKNEEAELLRWLGAKAQETAPPPAPEPAKPKEQPSSLAAAGKGAMSAVTEGAGKIGQGLLDFVVPSTLRGGQYEPMGKLKDAKQIFDGIMSIMAAPAAAAQAGVEQKFQNMAPEQAQSVALKGGAWSLPEIIRKTLMLDVPQLRKKAHTPEEETALQSDMTWGEVAGLVSGIVAQGVAMKGLSKVTGRGGAGEKPPGAPLEGEIVEPQAGQPALPGQRATIVNEPIPGQGQTQRAIAGTQPAVEGRVGATPALEAGTTGPIEGVGAVQQEGMRALPPGVYEAPGETARPAAETGLTYQKWLGMSPGERAAQLDVLSEQLRGKPFTTTGGVSEPTMPQAAAVAEVTPKVEAEFTRTLDALEGTREAPKQPAARGQHYGKTVDVGTVTLSDPEEVRILIRDAGGIARSSLSDFEGLPKDLTTTKGGVAFDEFVQEIAEAQGKRPKDVERQLIRTMERYGTEREAMGGLMQDIRASKPPDDIPIDVEEWKGMSPGERAATVEWMRAQDDYYKLGEEGGSFLDESGKADPKLLARIAVGGAIGCATGEDATECAKRALIGAGVGAVLSGRLAKQVGSAFEQRQAGESVPGAKSQTRVQASEQPFQPNYRRLDYTPQVKDFSVELHRAIKDDILARRGPAKSNVATHREALARIESGKFTPERVLTLGDEEMLSAEDMTAARILTSKAVETTQALTARINKGEVLPPGQYSTALSVTAAMARNTRVAQTRQAQALQANTIPVGLEKVGYSFEDVAHLADEIRAGQTDQELAALFSPIKGPAQLEKTMSILSVFPRAAMQMMYASYLSGRAVSNNLLGNLLPMALAPGETAVARFMPILWKAKPGELERVLPGEASLKARALGEALVDHVQNLKHWDVIEQNAKKFGVAEGISKSDARTHDAFENMGEIMGGEGGQLARLGHYVDNATNFFPEILNRTDLASKGMWASMQARVEAAHQAVAEGMTGEAFVKRTAELEADPSLLRSAARQRIVDVAETNTYTGEFESNYMKALAKGPDSQWANAAYRAFLVPFFRVIVHDLDQGLARSPGLHFISKFFWDQFLKGGHAQQMAMGRLVHGAAIMGAFMYFESQGWVTGNGPDGAANRKMVESMGYPIRSFWDPVSEKWRSYDSLGWVTRIISTAADVSMAARRMPQADWAKLAVLAILSEINNLDSRTFTQSLSNVIEMFRTGGPDSQYERVMEGVRKQVAGWMKPGLARQAKDIVDPERRRVMLDGTYDDGLYQEWKALWDDVSSAWPYFSSRKDEYGNDLVPPDRDPITGQPSITSWWPFLPFPAKNTPQEIPVTKPDGSKTGVREEIRRLNGAGLHEYSNFIGGGQPPADLGLSQQGFGGGVRLTPQARDRVQVLMTQVVTDPDGNTYGKALKAAMEDPLYWSMLSDGQTGKDGSRADRLRGIERAFRTMAEEAFYQENEQATPPGMKTWRSAVIEKKTERQLQKLQPQEQTGPRQHMKELLDNVGR